MSTVRMEAFSDAVIAIVITVMVLGLQVPHETTWAALNDVLPILLTYVLSFVTLGIYWNNHHHMLQTTDRVSGGVLWANLHLLFWLSLIPFTTGWLGQNDFASIPAAAYGVVLLASAIAYFVLQSTIIRQQGQGSLLARAIGRDWKGKASPLLYAGGIVLSFANRWAAIAVYAGVALMWLIPDRRLERILDGSEGGRDASTSQPSQMSPVTWSSPSSRTSRGDQSGSGT